MDSVDVLEKINRSSLRFLQPLSPETTYQTIIEEAIKLVNGDEGYIALVKKGELVIKYAIPKNLKSIVMRRRGFSYASFSQKKAFITYMEEFKDIHPELVKSGIQSTIFIPLVTKRKSFGVMNIMSRQRIKRFTQKELSTLKLFGSMAILAIHKTELYAESLKALETRDLFVSMAAHELKTPVTTIFGYSELLLNNEAKKESKHKWVQSLHAECMRLKFLISDLLELNRINTGRLHFTFKECSLKGVIKRTIENFKFSYPEQKIILNDKIKGESILIGDYDKLIQVFINLLDNAAKFSTDNNSILVSLSEDDSNYIIRIRDKGRGIDEKDLPKIFRSYYKGTGTSHEGLGLGLFLVKSIVESHKGTVNLHSKKDKGTSVKITLSKMKKKKIP